MTEALLTLVTEGMTQLPVTQKPLAPIRRKLGTSACVKILRITAIDEHDEDFAWHRLRVSRVFRCHRDCASTAPCGSVGLRVSSAIKSRKCCRKWRKFGKADGALADLEMFVLVAMVVMQMNVLQAWPKSLDAGLNAAIDMGMPGIQSAHHGGMSDRVDEP